MALDTAISLTTLDEVKSFLGEDLQKDGIWIYCSQGDATAATVEVTDTTIVLIITGGVQAGTNTITFAAQATITALIAAINALTGWKSGRLCSGSASSTDLVVTGALSCAGSDEEITLKIIDNYLLTQLINRASDLINRYCNRLLKTTAYTREIYYGNGFSKLLLEQYPVTRVSRLSAGRANSFSIKNTSTDANFCTVEITATAIRLIVDGGTNADDTELTLADYDKIDDLITAINALAKGWSITTMATDTATRDASELLIRPAMSVDATSQAECETVDSDLTGYRLLNPTEARNEGIIERGGTFRAGQEYFINFTAGFITIPYALEQACIELVAYKYGQSKRAGSEDLKSESFGEGADYKYEKFNLADIKNILPASLLAELDLFKKRSF